MPALNPSRQNALLLAVLLFLQLLTMSASVRGAEGVTVLEATVIRVTAPVVWTARAVGGAVAGVFRGGTEMLRARGENRRLHEEVRALRAEASRLRKRAKQNDRLRELLDMRRALNLPAVGATIVSANLTDDARILVLDRGTEGGMRTDLPVVAWGGTVGRVVDVGRAYAKVRLLSDPNSGVAGIVQRSGVEGMILGRGDGRLDMVYVPRLADVELGDRVVTSGLDGVFPRGFGIGTVTYVGDGGGVSKTIRLAPEVDVGSLDEVLVLVEPATGDASRDVAPGAAS